MKKEYKVIMEVRTNAFDAQSALVKEINLWFKYGWKLVGGVSTMYDTYLKKYYFSQALEREVEE